MTGRPYVMGSHGHLGDRTVLLAEDEEIGRYSVA